MPGAGVADEVVADLAVRDRLDGDRDAAVGARAVGQRVGAPQADAVDVDADADVLAGHVAAPSRRPGGSRGWRRRAVSGWTATIRPRRSAPRAQRVEEVEVVGGQQRGGGRARRAGQPGRGSDARRRRVRDGGASCVQRDWPIEGKVLTSRRESTRSLCSEGTNHGSRGDRRHARGAARARTSTTQVVRRCASSCPRWPTHTVAADHRRGARLRRRAQRRDGREHRDRGADGARRLPQAGRPRPGTPTRARRSARRSRAPTSSAAARRAAAARWTRCSRPTGSAPGWPGASWPRPRCAAGLAADDAGAVRRAGLRLHRRAVRRQRRRAHRRAGDHRPGPRALPASGWPSSCSPARRAGRARRGRRAGRLDAAADADRGAAARRRRCAACSAVARRRARCSRPRTCPALEARPTTLAVLLVPDADGPARPAPARARSTGRDAVVGPGPAVDGGARVVRPGRCGRSRSACAAAAAPAARHRGAPRRAGAHAPTREALADLRARVLAPLADLRPATAREARRDAARPGCCTRAAATRSPPSCFVHPQTVRYRMGQLRELYGDRLDDPAAVLELVIALLAPRPRPRPSPSAVARTGARSATACTRRPAPPRPRPP